MGWISVKDKMPDKNNIEYLVTDGNYYKILRFIDNKWQIGYLDHWCDEFITHWMPLPNLPK